MESALRLLSVRCRWIVAVLMLIVAPACDQVPTFQELTGKEKQTDGVAPDQIAQDQESAEASTAPPMPAAESPKTPQEIVDAFLATEPRMRTVAQLTELSELDPQTLQQITQLDLKQSQINDPSAPLIAKFPALEALDISGTAITNNAMKDIAQAKGLRYVYLDQMLIDGDGLKELADHQQMKEISLVNTPITDAAFVHLQKMDGLEVLRVSGTRTIQGHGFDELVKNGVMANLREFYAEATGIGYYGLRNLKKLPALEVLVIPDAQVSDQQLTGLAACRNLKVLNIQQNPVGNDTLKLIGKLDQLEMLNVGSCIGVNDDGLKHLRGLKNLTFLNLGGCQCTEEAVRELKEKHLKNTEIHFNQLVL